MIWVLGAAWAAERTVPEPRNVLGVCVVLDEPSGYTLSDCHPVLVDAVTAAMETWEHEPTDVTTWIVLQSLQSGEWIVEERDQQPILGGVVLPTARPPAPQEASGEPVTVAVLHRVEPDYPRKARRNHRDGHCMARVFMDVEGVPTRVDILSCSEDYFEAPAAEAVEQWRFEPVQGDEGPIPATFELRVDFTTPWE